MERGVLGGESCLKTVQTGLPCLFLVYFISPDIPSSKFRESTPEHRPASSFSDIDTPSSKKTLFVHVFTNLAMENSTPSCTRLILDKRNQLQGCWVSRKQKINIARLQITGEKNDRLVEKRIRGADGRLSAAVERLRCPY